MKSKNWKLLRNSCHLIIFICSLSSWYLNLWPEGNALHPFFRFSQQASMWKIQTLKSLSESHLSALILLKAQEQEKIIPWVSELFPGTIEIAAPWRTPRSTKKLPCEICRESVSPCPGSNKIWTGVFAEQFMHSKLPVSKLFW